MPLWEAFVADAPAAVAALLRGLSASHRRVVVMYDVINAFAAEEAARLPNGEGFAFHCTAASSIAWHMDGGAQLMRDVHGLDDLPVHAFVTEEFLEFIGKRARSAQTIPSSAGVIMNTSRALEGEFIDLVTQQLAAAGGKKVFSVGPINPMLGSSAHGPGATRHECLGWLDKQPAASVLYVSFGSMSSLRGEQIKELATALRGSNQRFIWVLRDADRADIYSESGESRHAKFLSEFTKETEGTGLVITGWAPQLEILAHGATAAFLSHCGWNSTMESMSHGKPILAWPMHSDQPWDAELVCKYLKAGFLVRPCEKHAEVIPAATIQAVIERLMVSDDGLPVRQRATAIGEAVRASAADGGSSRKDLEKFIAHITR
jgi:cis-zeatin O-glucosyltransferase